MTQPSVGVVEGAIRPGLLRMGMASFLVDHPDARFLIDPSMCQDVHDRVLPEVPAPWRALVGLPRTVHGLAAALNERDIAPASIDFVLPTHLHWDHVAGLLDLPAGIPIRVRKLEWDWATSSAAVPLAVARGPLRERRVELFDLDRPGVLSFESSADLFDDGSVIVVNLPGHTPGSVGILLTVDGGRRVLLAGDAVWHGLQITQLRRKSAVGRLVDTDPATAFKTVHRLHTLPPGIDVIAAHDRDAWSQLVRR